MILVPAVGVVVSFMRGRSDVYGRNDPQSILQVKGQAGGTVAFVFAGASAVLVVVLFRWAVLGRDERTILWLSLAPAIVAVIISNYLLDRHDGPATRPSWFARWAGLLGTFDIGAFIALNLIYITREQEVAEPVSHLQEQLSGVSYLILSVVFLLIVGGLGWCFYKAMMATSNIEEPQSSDEIGDAE